MKAEELIKIKKRIISLFGKGLITTQMTGQSFDIKIGDFFEISFIDGVLSFAQKGKDLEKRYIRKNNSTVFFDPNFEILRKILNYLETDRKDFLKLENEFKIENLTTRSGSVDGLFYAIDQIAILLKSISKNCFERDQVEEIVMKVRKKALIEQVIAPFYGVSINSEDWFILYADSCQYLFLEKNFDRDDTFVMVNDSSVFLIESKNGTGWYLDIDAGYRYRDDKFFYLNDITKNISVPLDSEDFSGYIFKNDESYEKYKTVLKEGIDLSKEPRVPYFSANNMVFQLKRKKNRYSLHLLDGQLVENGHPDLLFKIISQPPYISELK